jgi:ATP-dependent RNA helicase RhlE
MGFKKFNLDPRLLAAVVRAGYVVPTPVQDEAIPAAMSGHDIVGTAQTGTGKTAAFVLPILNRLLEGHNRRLRVLVLAPTRELAEQTHEAFRTFGMGTGIRSATVYGGVGPAPQIKALKDGVEVLVACPGRLLDHMEQGLVRFDHVEVLVLDEADRMFDMGFLPQVRRILKRIPARRQTMLFSATFPAEVEALAAEMLRHPKRIAIGISKPAHTVSHALFPVTPHLKTRLLLALLEHTDTESVLVFTRTKHRAEKVLTQIKHAGYKATSLHGNRSQGQRQASLAGFRDGTYPVMIATDIAARGLDIENISHVINYDMPDTADAYIHRIGRTGRAERTGDAFTLATPEDEAMVKTLEKIMGRRLERRMLEGFDYHAPAPPRTTEGPGGSAFHRPHARPLERPASPYRRPASAGAEGADRRPRTRPARPTLPPRPSEPSTAPQYGRGSRPRRGR